MSASALPFFRRIGLVPAEEFIAGHLESRSMPVGHVEHRLGKLAARALVRLGDSGRSINLEATRTVAANLVRRT